MKERIQENRIFEISHDGIDYKCWIESNYTTGEEFGSNFRYFMMHISKEITKEYFNLFGFKPIYKSNYEFKHYLPNNIRYEAIDDVRFFKIEDIKNWLITGLNEHERYQLKKAIQKNELLDYKHIEKIK